MADNYGPLHFDQRHAQSFDAWREWWFDYLCRPTEGDADKAPYWRLEVESRYAPFGSATSAAEALTTVFETSSDLVSKFGLDGAARGLWKIASPATVEYGHSLWDANADSLVVERALAAMPRLFTDLFEVRCDPCMSSSGSESTNPLNQTCYMWFDLIVSDRYEAIGIWDERLRLMLKTMTVVLNLPHLACQESALHGLGHIAEHKPALVKPIIAEFLRRFPKTSFKLRTYAELAAEGHVQ